MATLAIDYKTGLNNAWSNIATFIPKLVVFLIILVVGYLIAKAIAKILTKVLQKVGFDERVERGGVQKARAKSEYDAAGILSQVVFYAIMLFVLSTAFGVFGTNPISGYLHSVIAYLPLVFIAIVILVIGAAVAAAAKALIENSLGGLSYGTLLANVASSVIIALFAIAALDQLHIAQNVVNALLYATLAAVVGVVIVAVGGGGISTMSARWQAMADKYDQEKDNMRAQVRSAPSIREQAQQAKAKAQSAAGSDSAGTAGARRQ